MATGQRVTWQEVQNGARGGRVLAYKEYRGAAYVLVTPDSGSIREKWLSVACVQKAETAAIATAS